MCALDYGASVVIQVQQFYRSVQQGASETTPTLPEMPILATELRRYQRQAVSWMLAREGAGQEIGGGGGGETLHMLWRQIPVQQPWQCYFNPYTTRLVPTMLLEGGNHLSTCLS